MLLFTFLSSTIQSMSLPKVAVEKPEMGSLDLSISEEGYLQPAYSAPLTPSGNWTVAEVHVQKGDRVRKGDPLITFDPSDTERTLEDEKTRYKQAQLQLEQLQEAMKPLLRAGEQDAIDKQTREIEVKKLDMVIAGRTIDELEKQIGEGRVLEAPFDGVVESITAEEGIRVSAAQTVCELASDASGYQLVIAAEGDAASALQIGRSVQVEVGQPELRLLEGTIDSVEDAESQGIGGSGGGSDVKTVTIDVNGTDLSPGMKATVYIDQESASPGFKISSDALHSDGSGSYVFTVTTEEGPLGSSYFARKTYVDAGEENDGTVIILSGLMPDERIVTDSGAPLSDGDRVRLE
ncbi:efflux RND transporter periplasmic adaptor subunit [Cohnella thailandensis]|uniref:Efflux RND transporter periplasmic adaptor subunit n=1 Tax=Cohnella thailandensis TaxID=557557 RepID=A0A841T9W0_9BACL|nr:efflux RND transporter periplasmic adaptor subunit [Cohnella thailandensis]MBB6638001.1 efflux RND transporter periplasmic adaptor subunit [Cohnella thailandensis]MBP1976859.1 RND family efflux transporter MFP subunit [Cohnella thailandensis]